MFKVRHIPFNSKFVICNLRISFKLNNVRTFKSSLVKETGKINSFCEVHNRRVQIINKTSKNAITYTWKNSTSSNSSSVIVQSLTKMFLPVGYPNSCHKVYKKVHYWQFIETFLGSTVSVLCSEAMLSSIGLSKATATGGAVAIQWVLKDGFGEIGKLFFIQQSSQFFDSHPKTWKLVGEVCCLLGSTLQLCTVMVSSTWFLLLASTGYAFRSIHFSIWNATHMTFTKNFAQTGNVADLVAKDDAQMSVAHLCGMLAGVSLLSISNSPLFLFTVFFIVAPLHFKSSVNLLNAASFAVLNTASLTLVCKGFCKEKVVFGEKEIKKRLMVFDEFIDWKKCQDLPKLVVGSQIKNEFLHFDDLKQTVDFYANEEYIINIRDTPNFTFGIIFFENLESRDIIKSFLNAIKVHDLLLSGFSKKDAVSEGYLWTNNNFELFLNELDKSEWDSEVVYFGDSGIRLCRETPI